MEILINKYIWGWPLLALILVVGIYFSFKIKFFHIREMLSVPRLVAYKNKDGDRGVSSFSAMMILLGSHIGVGNLMGVSLAISVGGPGAVFWMWMSALILSVLSFFENTLGQIYQQEINHTYTGGAAYYIANGLNAKHYAKFVAIILFLSIGLLMPMIQTATIITTFNNTFGLSKVLISLCLVLMVAYIIFSGRKRIVETMNICVPFMALLFVLLSLIIIMMNVRELPTIFILIFNSAFNKNSYYGGLMGTAFSFGLRRGAFSHEAGMGTAPSITAQSRALHPVAQGIISAFCVFIDTIFLCTLTALMLLLTGKYNVIYKGNYLHWGVPGDYNVFLDYALDTITWGNGSLVVTILIFFFAFTAMMGSFFNAQANLYFIFQRQNFLSKLTFLYKILFVGLIFLAGFVNTNFGWLMADLGLGLIGWINIFVLLLLAKDVYAAINSFKSQYKRKK